jgi:hypothetical protein
VKTAKQLLEMVMQTSQRLGPYVLIELVLPGGTMFALALFLYRHPEVLRRHLARVRAGLGQLRSAVSGAIAAARTAVAVHSSVSLTAGIETAVRALG